jgi:Spy/CpxP family protein refolding chaperone
MAKMKQSQLKEVFKRIGLSEGMFDIFNKKKKELQKQLKVSQDAVEDIITSAPTDEEKQKLRDLSNALKAYYALRR